MVVVWSEADLKRFTLTKCLRFKAFRAKYERCARLALLEYHSEDEMLWKAVNA